MTYRMCRIILPFRLRGLSLRQVEEDWGLAAVQDCWPAEVWGAGLWRAEGCRLALGCLRGLADRSPRVCRGKVSMLGEGWGGGEAHQASCVLSHPVLCILRQPLWLLAIYTDTTAKARPHAFLKTFL